MISRTATDAFEIRPSERTPDIDPKALGIGHYHVVCHDCRIEKLCNERSSAQATVDLHRARTEHNIEYQELSQ